MRRAVERRTLLALIWLSGWVFAESRLVLIWAGNRLARLEARP